MRRNWKLWLLAGLLALLGLAMALCGCGSQGAGEDGPEAYDLEQAVAALEAAADQTIWQTAQGETQLAQGQGFTPTYYHEGMELVSAYVERECALDQGADTCDAHLANLYVRMEYTGDSDVVPEGWYLEYNLRSNSHDEEGWGFVGYRDSGGSSLSDCQVNWQLPLAEDFPADKYQLPQQGSPGSWAR